MTIASAADGARAIELSRLVVSDTGSQTERRRHFDKAAIAELAESIKTVGLLSPIIARPKYQIDVVEGPSGGRWYPAYKKKHIDGHNFIGTGFDAREAAQAEAIKLRTEEKLEVVAGERRFIAAKQAGLSAINVSVRTLTDEQVLEIQLVENLQREGLHELAEAEGYEALQQLGHSAEEIAGKVGKSKGYVYSRMKLLALSKTARAAFYDGKLTASTALLLARIPVENTQAEALKAITAKRWNDAVMTFREAADLIRREYMTNLSGAGFPTEDAALVPAAGACGACPKRTGNQAELFDDVKSGNVCTDPICFKAKREAHAARAIVQAKEIGQTVITGKEAKKILPYGADSQVQGGFENLSSRCYQDSKGRTYAQLLGKGFTPTLVQDPQSGVLVKVASPDAVKAALKEHGIGRSSSSSGSGTEAAAQKKAQIERRVRQRIFAEVRDHYPTALARADLERIAQGYFSQMQHETRKQLMALWQWEPTKKGYETDYEKPFAAGIAELKDAELTRLLLDCVYITDLQVSTWSNAKPLVLLAAATRHKIDVSKIRKDLTAAAPKPKAAKKKAKGKK